MNKLIFQIESPIFEALTNKSLNYGEIYRTEGGAKDLC